jgi:Flp pilus assembly protein TadG
MLLKGGHMKRNQRGATVVEAALILPILLMFLISILEFGRAYNEYHVLTNAAREACRYAVAPTAGNNGTLPGTAAVQQVATDWLNSAGISPSTPPSVSTVSCGTFTNPITGNVQPLNCTAVTVTVPFSFLAPQLLFGNNGPSIAMTSTATMRQETNP